MWNPFRKRTAKKAERVEDQDVEVTYFDNGKPKTKTVPAGIYKVLSEVLQNPQNSQNVNQIIKEL